MSLLQLYLLFAKVSTLTFGGGYAMIPLFQDEIVVKHAYMDAPEFANLVALAQVTPGPLGLNAATFVGMNQAGIPGALCATLGMVTPSFLFTVAAAIFLRRMAKSKNLGTVLSGIRPCVLGIIAAAVVFFAETSVLTCKLRELLHNPARGICWQGAVVFAVVLAVQLRWKRLNVVWLLAISAVLGWLLFLCSRNC
ncbi:MAG: chromate transporter [Kiritimatiellae bacterium]|nr:chromate transporter [Kiritimatiellia bacterium]